VETEAQQGKAFFDAAQAAGVRHFVYTSVARGGFVPTAVPHFASKHAIEAHIRTTARDTNWTVLQPVAFMDNLLAGGFQARAFFTSLKYYLGQKPLQYIAAEDIGKFAARVLAVRALVAVTFAVDAHAAHTGPSQVPRRERRARGGLAARRGRAADLQRAQRRELRDAPGLHRVHLQRVGDARAREDDEVVPRHGERRVLSTAVRALTGFSEQGFAADSVAQTKRAFPDVMDFETWVKQTLARK
jgi:hypothetical protein